MHIHTLTAAAVLGNFVLAGAALAQQYPDRSVRVLVGRVELLTTVRIQELRAALAQAQRAGGASQRRIEEELHQQQGHFAEPMLKRALVVTTDPKERAHLEAVLANWAPVSAGGPVAIQ